MRTGDKSVTSLVATRAGKNVLGDLSLTGTSATKTPPQRQAYFGEIVTLLLRELRIGGVFVAAALALTSFVGDARAAARSDVHVYLMRGLLNVFSLGMDQIADQLQKQGIRTTVHNHLAWAAAAAEAAQEYKSGQAKIIIVVGHSQGATILPNMIDLLDENHVPVTLAIALDSIFPTTVSGRAEHYINYYVGNGVGAKVTASAAFRGKLENIDVENIPGVGHLNIDKNDVMQERVIAAIDAIALDQTASTHRRRRAVH
jgi:hypothetical protein